MRHARLVTFNGQHWPVSTVVLVSATPKAESEWCRLADLAAREAEAEAYKAQLDGGYTIGSVSVACVEEVEVRECP